MPRIEVRPRLLMGGAVLLGALLLYLVTLDNGLTPGELQGGDLITHHHAQAELRLANAPGYPLYTLLGWAWFQMGRLVFSSLLNPIEILSLFSTIWGLGALLVFYLLLLEVTEGNWIISGSCTLLYATTYFFWYYSVTSEEYTAGVLQSFLMILLAYRWERSRKDNYLLGIAFLVGLALANLVTVLLALPPLLLFILRLQPEILRRRELLAKSALLLFFPLLSYIYVYLQGRWHPEWRGVGEWPSAWAWFLHFLSTSQGRSELTWSLGGIPLEVPRVIVVELTLPVLLLGVGGIALLGRRRGGLLYGVLLFYALFTYVDRFGNWFQVVMPAYPLIVLGMAVLAHRLFRPSPNWARGLLILALALLVTNRLGVNFPRADQRDRPEDRGLDPGWAILKDEPPLGATIGGGYEEILALEYLKGVWGERRDIEMVEPEGFEKAFYEEGERLFLTKEGVNLVLPHLVAFPHLSSEGLTLIRVCKEANFIPPPTSHLLKADYGGELRLWGYDLFPSEEGLHLALYWQAIEKMESDYSISVRPTRDGEPLFVGEELLQEDHVHPVWGLYPTSRWLPGEVVRDDYLMPNQPAYDGLMVLVYLHTDEGFENLGTFTFALE
ncbi:MAG: protein O-mannosyl-transferase family [Anaerolineae bacterium]